MIAGVVVTRPRYFSFPFAVVKLNFWKLKSLPQAGRFYLKAISAYSSALELLSTSTDAAYNKARLQLTLTTNDGLLPPEINPRAMLHEALNTHLYCLGLPEGNSGHDIVLYALSSSGFGE